MNKNEKERQKKPYLKPKIEIHAIQTEGSMMITVSGTTTPEESQAKKYDRWMDDEDGLDSRPTNIWDD
jgi:hypothetical protein